MGPCRCLCFHRCCLSPPLPLLADDVIGDGGDLDPPVDVEDRQHAVLEVHVMTTMRRLMNVQRRGQTTVAKAEAAQGQTTINQKVAAKMFKIVL